MTITGTNLADANEVEFAGTEATIISETATKVKVTVPAGATSGPVTVTTPEGTATTSNSFIVK